MKAEKDKSGNIKGYEIGNSISIHGHISDPEDWFITIRPLSIYAQPLCKKSCIEDEILKYIHVLLDKKRLQIAKIINEVALDRKELTIKA